ncbi:MAG: hypothetical protein ACI8PZ_004901 [Myxococcota bacterium]|jgi:hypothetical protein
MSRFLACVLLIACGGKAEDERVPFVEDTALPDGTEELRQACYEACDARYLGADGCPAETAEELRDGCNAECVDNAPVYIVSCEVAARAYYQCIEDVDWLCAQGEDEPRSLEDDPCSAEISTLEACPA